MADIRVPSSERCLRVLERTPGILRSLLSLATPEQLDWRPPWITTFGLGSFGVEVGGHL
jgi:hypothetical protein